MPTTANSGEFRWGGTGGLVIIELWQGPCGSPPLLWYWFPSAPEPISSQGGHKIMVQVQRGRFPTINQIPHAWRTPRYTSRVEIQTVPQW